MFSSCWCCDGVGAVDVALSNFCSYLIDSINYRGIEHNSLTVPACLPKLRYEHDAALAPR